MTVLGLDGEYVVSIKLFAVDPDQLKQAKKQQRNATVKNVSKSLSKMSVGELTRLVQGDKLASAALRGFGNLKNYKLDSLKGLMKDSSLKTAIGSVIKGIAAEARLSNPVKAPAATEIDLKLKETDFLELKVQEYLGVLLPTYSITFAVHDKKLYKYFNRSSRLEIGFGKTASDLTTMQCAIFKPIIRDDNDRGIVTLNGFYYAPQFLSTEVQISTEGTSYEAVSKAIQTSGLKIVSNVDASKFQDKMVWRASNSRVIEYIINLWKHSFVSPTSQIAPCITAKGEILWTDLSEARKLASSKTFQYTDRVTLVENPFYANFGGMRCKRYVHDIKTGALKLLHLNDKESAIASKIGSKISGMRIGKFGYLAPEMHANWFLAELLNHSRLLSSLQQTAWINPHATWVTYKPTDIITLNSVESADAGQYLVSGRCAHIHGRQFDTWIQIARDSYANVTGVDLK